MTNVTHVNQDVHYSHQLNLNLMLLEFP